MLPGPGASGEVSFPMRKGEVTADAEISRGWMLMCPSPDAAVFCGATEVELFELRAVILLETGSAVDDGSTIGTGKPGQLRSVIFGFWEGTSMRPQSRLPGSCVSFSSSNQNVLYLPMSEQPTFDQYFCMLARLAAVALPAEGQPVSVIHTGVSPARS